MHRADLIGGAYQATGYRKRSTMQCTRRTLSILFIDRVYSPFSKVMRYSDAANLDDLIPRLGVQETGSGSSLAAGGKQVITRIGGGNRRPEVGERK